MSYMTEVRRIVLFMRLNTTISVSTCDSVRHGFFNQAELIDMYQFRMSLFPNQVYAYYEVTYLENERLN